VKRAIAVIIAAFGLSGCGREAPQAPPVSSSPQRIVSLAPSATEMLFAVGAGSRVVGTDDFSNYPPEVRRLPRTGGTTVNYEAVAALKPDLVVGVSDLQAASLERCRSLGLRVLALDTTTLPRTVEALRRAGTGVGDPDAGNDAAAALQQALSRVSRAVSGLPPVRVVFVAEATPSVIVAGRRTFVNEVIETAGGENAIGAPGFVSLGREAQRAALPDVVLAGDEADARALRRVWPYPARVVVMPRDILVRPGPRLGEGARWLATVLHPEIRKP
jgi:ABC-type hemin transport system substrate-binding protein